MKNKCKGKVGNVALKIYISKAYDRVDWRFLVRMLRKMGFGERWIKWIQMCVCTVSYSFMVNDSLMGSVVP